MATYLLLTLPFPFPSGNGKAFPAALLGASTGLHFLKPSTLSTNYAKCASTGQQEHHTHQRQWANAGGKLNYRPIDCGARCAFTHTPPPKSGVRSFLSYEVRLRIKKSIEVHPTGISDEREGKHSSFRKPTTKVPSINVGNRRPLAARCRLLLLLLLSFGKH